MTGQPDKDDDMTKSDQSKSTGEETEPEPFVNPEGDDEVNGIEGQIIYPDAETDAEHAAAYAAGKEDSLYPDDEDGDRVGWQNPADRPEEELTDDDDEPKSTKRSSKTSPVAKKTS